MDHDFIKWAEDQLGDDIVINREPHGDQSAVYHLVVPRGNYFLKIAPTLEEERVRLEWADGKLPVPKVMDFVHFKERDGLLLSAIEGVNLAKLCKEWPADKVINKFAEALRRFHAVSVKGCPFGKPGPKKILVHGDACLPNFIMKGNKFSGYIDLGDMRIDAVEIDLSAAVWSLEYNLGQGHGIKFLEEYGIKNATEKLVKKLILRYERTQEEWGLS